MGRRLSAQVRRSDNPNWRPMQNRKPLAPPEIAAIDAQLVELGRQTRKAQWDMTALTAQRRQAVPVLERKIRELRAKDPAAPQIALDLLRLFQAYDGANAFNPGAFKQDAERMGYLLARNAKGHLLIVTRDSKPMFLWQLLGIGTTKREFEDAFKGLAGIDLPQPRTIQARFKRSRTSDGGMPPMRTLKRRPVGGPMGRGAALKSRAGAPGRAAGSPATARGPVQARPHYAPITPRMPSVKMGGGKSRPTAPKRHKRLPRMGARAR